MISPLLGGLLIGIGAGLMMVLRGKIAGCSGMLFRSIVPWQAMDKDAAAFMIGLLAAGLVGSYFIPMTSPWSGYVFSPLYLYFGGLLVGMGTYLANGCTSGHGLCGLSLMRKRSIIAVLLFFCTAMLTAYLRFGG